MQIDPVTGGTPGYIYSLAAGSTLPAGLTLSGAGLISGIPITSGNYTFSVMATDSKGCAAAATFILTVQLGGITPATLNKASFLIL